MQTCLHVISNMFCTSDACSFHFSAQDEEIRSANGDNFPGP